MLPEETKNRFICAQYSDIYTTLCQKLSDKKLKQTADYRKRCHDSGGGGCDGSSWLRRRGFPIPEAELTPVIEVDLLPGGKVIDQRA